MAQRGGNVVSHLKVSARPSNLIAGSPPPFVSPLIRPGRADILLALHPEGEAAHGHYLRAGGTIIANRPEPSDPLSVDAAGIALNLGSPVSANLVLLGFAAGSGLLFCPPEQVRATLERLGGKRLEISLKAFQAGWDEDVRRQHPGGVGRVSETSAS
jgi:indolepyruvate ferredoxin oxidoreductase beta subunit